MGHISPSVPLRNILTASRHGSRFWAARVLVPFVIVVLASCGSSQRVDTATGPLHAKANRTDPPTSVVVAPGQSGTDISEVEGLSGDRLPVIDGTSGRTGWVDRGALIAPAGGEPPQLSPVYDDAGQQIAYWANGLGWLSSDVVEAPDFNLQQRLDARPRPPELESK